MTMNRAFTLVETMIAVTILTLAVAGPLFTASRVIVAAQTARDQLTASYLAQEGVEYVRAMRDGSYLFAYRGGGGDVSTVAWNEFLASSDATSIAECRAPSVCSLDPTLTMGYGTGLALLHCGNNGCPQLYLLNNGAYTVRDTLGGTATSFSRSVQVVYVSDTEEKVISRVSWTFHGIPYSVTASDHLTPWQ